MEHTLLFDADRGQAFKALVHVALCSLAVTCGLYAAGAYQCRRERRLLVNGCLYSAVTAWEVWQIARHLNQKTI